jgi:hypothetical protein
MISVDETKDLGVVRDILVHEDIWWRIAGADDSVEDFTPPEDATYLLATIDDTPAGLLVILPNFDSHFQLLPEYRNQKYEVGAAVLAKAKEYTDRLTTDIGKDHPNVHHFALKNGYNVLREDADNWYYEKVL